MYSEISVTWPDRQIDPFNWFCSSNWRHGKQAILQSLSTPSSLHATCSIFFHHIDRCHHERLKLINVINFISSQHFQNQLNISYLHTFFNLFKSMSCAKTMTTSTQVTLIILFKVHCTLWMNEVFEILWRYLQHPGQR